MKTKIKATPETQELNFLIAEFDQLTAGRFEAVNDIEQLYRIAYGLLLASATGSHCPANEEQQNLVLLSRIVRVLRSQSYRWARKPVIMGSIIEPGDLK